MDHSSACAAVQLFLSDLGCMTARHYSGMVTTANGQKRKIGTPGHADLSGVTFEGRAIAVEVKVGRDRTKINQLEWANAWDCRNGLYAVIRPDRDGWKDELRALVKSAAPALAE